MKNIKEKIIKKQSRTAAHNRAQNSLREKRGKGTEDTKKSFSLERIL